VIEGLDAGAGAVWSEGYGAEGLHVGSRAGAAGAGAGAGAWGRGLAEGPHLCVMLAQRGIEGL
jgi:hypothetical protein